MQKDMDARDSITTPIHMPPTSRNSMAMSPHASGSKTGAPADRKFLRVTLCVAFLGEAVLLSASKAFSARYAAKQLPPHFASHDAYADVKFEMGSPGPCRRRSSHLAADACPMTGGRAHGAVHAAHSLGRLLDLVHGTRRTRFRRRLGARPTTLRPPRSPTPRPPFPLPLRPRIARADRRRPPPPRGGPPAVARFCGARLLRLAVDLRVDLVEQGCAPG